MRCSARVAPGTVDPWADPRRRSRAAAFLRLLPADDDFDATVLLSPGHGLVVRDRRVLTMTRAGEALSLDTTAHQIALHRVRPAFRERLVGIFTAHAVGEAFDGRPALGIFIEEIGEAIQVGAGTGLDLRFSRVEQGVTQGQHKAAIRGFCLQELELTL